MPPAHSAFISGCVPVARMMVVFSLSRATRELYLNRFDVCQFCSSVVSLHGSSIMFSDPSQVDTKGPHFNVHGISLSHTREHCTDGRRQVVLVKHAPGRLNGRGRAVGSRYWPLKFQTALKSKYLPGSSPGPTCRPPPVCVVSRQEIH